VSEEILRERRGRILVITINQPESRNALNLTVSQDLADAVDELDASDELSVAVITHHADLHVQRRQGGRDRIRGEARAQLDWHLTATAPWISG
jgi:1,4-dihydroxy-2-naphthoyl-CoA synthase